MTIATWFTPHTADTAPEAARGAIAASQKQLGFLASPIAKAAGSPQLLEYLLAGFPAFDQGSLTHVEREVLAMTVGYEVGCHYCMALHSALGARHPEVAPLVPALRENGPLDDAKLEALRALVRALVRDHVADAATWGQFAAAGYTDRNGLDVILGVGVYLLSTIANLATGAELEPHLAAFAWQR